MSIKNVGHYFNKHDINLSSKGLVGSTNVSPSLDGWVRNQFWNPISANANSIVGLYAVWPGGGNFFAFTGAGAYTIDYGNGVTTNYSSGSTAYYEYDYSASALDGTDCPIYYEEATNTFYHGEGYIENGTILKFYNNDFVTNLKINHPYYVVNSEADLFQVSETLGGSPISFTGDGNVTLLPYKLVTVTITPQAGQNLTSANFFVKHNQADLVNGYNTGWLELKINCPSLTSLFIGNGATTIRHLNLENVVLEDVGNISSLYDLMRNCYNLRSFELNDSDNVVTDMGNLLFSCFNLTDVSLYNTSNVTNMSSMFSNCYALTSVPLFDTSSVTNMSSMFSSCSALTSVPLFDTSSVTDMIFMFSSCSALTSVSLFDTSSVTGMSSMFNSCSALTSVPLFDTSSVTDMGSMFFNCYSLTNVPLFDTSSVTNMNNMFNNCYALTSVPLFDTSSVTNISLMFNQCRALTNVPLFDTSSVTNMIFMFTNCFTLITVPLFDTSSVTNMNNMFSSCYSLTNVPLFDTSSVTSMNSMFNSCYSLTNVPLFDTSSVTSMASMFSNCRSLATVPLFDTSSVTNMSSTFSNCSNLITVPLFDTSSVTGMSSTFSGCSNLITVPLFDTSSVTSMSFMFGNCYSLTSVPAWNVTGVTNFGFSNMFYFCASLSRIEAEGFRFTFSVLNCKLNATELNAIYTRLPTVTGQTITVTGNYGRASDNPSIATAKGWTVTG